MKNKLLLLSVHLFISRLKPAYTLLMVMYGTAFAKQTTNKIMQTLFLQYCQVSLGTATAVVSLWKCKRFMIW